MHSLTFASPAVNGWASERLFKLGEEGFLGPGGGEARLLETARSRV